MAYKPFKMKGHTLPGINQKLDDHPKNVAEQGLSGSSPFQDYKKGYYGEGKSPTKKALVGKQHNLPEDLKAEIKASPGKMYGKKSPTKYAQYIPMALSILSSLKKDKK